MSETFRYFTAFMFLALIAPAIKWVLNLLRHN